MDAREEHLLTVHARERERTLGGGPLAWNVCDCTYIIVGIKSQYIFTSTSFQEGPHQKLFIYLLQNEDEGRARVHDILKTSLAFLWEPFF